MRSLIDPSPTEEVDQIDPNIGNGEGSSNTFNGAVPDLSRPRNINNDNPDNDINTAINAQVTAAQTTK
jgi:hypothetical protein